MNELRYPFAALRADYLRAAAGLALTLGPALAVPAGSAALYVLGPAAALFLAFGVRTWQRQRSRVRLGLDAISLFSVARVSLAWNDLHSIKLSYFSTRGDRTGGWMQMTLKGEDPQRRGTLRTIRLDSSLEGFADVARRAADAARAKGLLLSEPTRSNFAALGIALDTPMQPMRLDGAA